MRVTLFAAKPGLVIGKGGTDIEVTKKQLEKLTGKKVALDIKEIKRPDKDAQLVAENIAQQLENRVSFRRAMESRPPLQAVLAVRILPVRSFTVRERFPSRHCVRILITDLQKLIQLLEN